MVPLTIHLFGGLTIQQDSNPIPKLISRKADVLLAYLAQNPRPHSRETLATLLWDDRPQKQALSNLRTVITSLRKKAEPFVSITRQTLTLADEVWVDTAVFQQQLAAAAENWPRPAAAAQMEQALALYVGDFLDGVLVSDSIELEEWIQFSREQLRQQAIDARQNLITYYLNQGDYSAGTRHASILLEIDPWNEEAHRQMMQLLARSGQRQAALAQYETCVKLLDEELGIPPEPATTELYERIQTAVTTPTANLPAIATSFVGRERELSLCLEQLRDPECRLLTIVGLGGMGKTRLALQVAATLQMDFLNGVFFVPLAAVESADGVATAVAEAIDAPFDATKVKTQLINYLRGKEMLLVLDNFEHLLSAANFIADLLRQAPALTLLVTSRVRLDVQAEWLMELTGLPYPDDKASDSEQYAAVQLFWQRARVVDLNFALSDDNLSSVNRICRIVQGMPLGIELAAAWIRVLSPAQIVQQIEQNLDLLATTARDVPERQQSLTAVFDSVWSLLDENEQHVFAQLSVFRGDFDLNAFLQITGASPWSLAALVEKSLLQKESNNRYHLVELLRMYSATKLAANPANEATIRQKHSDYYLAFLQEQQTLLDGRQQRQALQAIGRERDSIRAAWLWAIKQANLCQINNSSSGLTCFYQRNGPFLEGAQLLQAALDQFTRLTPTQVDDPYLHRHTLAQLHLFIAYFQHESGLHEQTEASLQAAEACLQDAPDAALLARLHLEQGRIMWWKSEHETATHWMQSALTVSREHGLPATEAWALRNLGAIALQQADYPTAEAYYREALPITQQIGDLRQESKLINNMGVIYTETGDLARAQDYLERSLHLKGEVGDLHGQAMSLNNIGRVAMERGRYSESYDYFEQSRQLRVRLGDWRGQSVVNINLGQVYRHVGQYERAKALLQQALTTAREIGSPLMQCESLIVSGIIQTQIGDYEAAHTFCRQGAEIGDQKQHRSLAAWAQHGLGYALLGLGRLDEAADMFTSALTMRQALGEHPRAVESRAGLAEIALLRGDLATAVTCVEAIWSHLQAGDLATTDIPFAIYLTCCRVFAAANDERYAALLHDGYQQLQSRVRQITNPAWRQSYLENVAAHAELMRLYQSV